PQRYLSPAVDPSQKLFSNFALCPLYSTLKCGSEILELGKDYSAKRSNVTFGLDPDEAPENIVFRPLLVL
ncbi:hypothetical protein MK292_09505, partial [Myxococcota bacterium]|nr:hypothetical protein [Myxococcota bacterium]